MAATPADLKEELPAFAALSNTVIQKWLDRVAKMMNACAWGDLYNDGQIYLAAHHMACAGLVSGVSATAGAVKSKTVGPVSVTYATSDAGSTSDKDLERTQYGRTFKSMRATRTIGPMVL